MNTSDYEASLLKWDKVVSNDTQDAIYQKLKTKMKEIDWAAFFTSPSQTMLYIETPSGVKRDCFAHKSKNRGRNAIMECEPPVPWSKTVNPHNLVKEMTEFLRAQYWSVTIRGDNQKAYLVIKELQ